MGSRRLWLGLGVVVLLMLVGSHFMCFASPVFVLGALARNAWIHLTSPERVHRDNIPSLQQEGALIVAALEAQHASAGQYPASLDHLQAAPPGADDWEYSRTDDDEYRLKIGVYPVHNFELLWDSRRDEWDVDM